MVRPKGFEPLTFWFVAKHSIQLSYERITLAILSMVKQTREHINKKWWLQRESNQRHRDFQSLALPTELWSQMAVSTGLEPAIFCVTGRRVNQLHHETKLVAGEGFEPTTFGLWAQRATKLLHPAIYTGGGKGIRTPAPFARPPGFQDRSLQPDLGIPPIVIIISNDKLIISQ